MAFRSKFEPTKASRGKITGQNIFLKQKKKKKKKNIL